MSDLIQEAIEDDTYEKEREASGVVDGTKVTVKKKSYRTKLQHEEWKVAVYLHGNDYASEQEASLTAEDAEELFNELVEKYNLGDEGTVFQQLSEMDEIDDETIERIKEITNRQTLDEPSVGNVSDKDDDIGREVTVEDCEECGGTLKKSSPTVHAPGFADSFEAECVHCGHTQHIPAW